MSERLVVTLASSILAVGLIWAGAPGQAMLVVAIGAAYVLWGAK